MFISSLHFLFLSHLLVFFSLPLQSLAQSGGADGGSAAVSVADAAAMATSTATTPSAFHACLSSLNVVCALNYIQSGFDFTAPDSAGGTALITALSHRSLHPCAVLMLNAKSAHMPISTFVNVRRPSDGYTALFAIVTATPDDGKDNMLLRAVVKKGADPSAALPASKGDREGWTPMHFAARDGDLKGLKLMLEYGGDPNATAKDGTTIADAVDVGHQGSWIKRKVVAMLNEAIDSMEEAEEKAKIHALENALGGEL